MLRGAANTRGRRRIPPQTGRPSPTSGCGRAAARRSRTSATRSPRRSSARRSRRCSQGRDLLGQAATGTGKTAAFALPMLQRTAAGRQAARRRAALVLVPTRELAMQVSEAIHRYGRSARRAACCRSTAAQPIGRQLQALRARRRRRGRHAGRALDHIGRGTLRLEPARRCVVLDEADEMLDMGFAEDIEAILRRDARGRARRCSSRRRCRRGSTPSPAATCATRVADPDRREPAAAGARRRCVRQSAYVVRARAQAGGARARARRRGADRRDRLLPHARSRSTSSPRRSTAAATAPRRCTAA